MGDLSSLRRLRLVAFDFDGVFTDNTVLTDADGRELVSCWRGDGLGLQKLRELGIATIVISTETNAVVSARCRKLGIACVQGVTDKGAELARIVARAGYRMDEVAFVGNDVNDLPCLRMVGLPIVVADAHPDTLGAARLHTRANGGRGAVREICDLISASRLPEDTP